MVQLLNRVYLLIAGFEMNILILNTVVSGACMDEDASNFLALPATRAGEHLEGNLSLVSRRKSPFHVPLYRMTRVNL